MAETHPPLANGVACVDFDGTIPPWGQLFDLPAPRDDDVEAMRELKKAGYRIVILTSRMSPTWWRAEHTAFGFADWPSFASANYLYVSDYLRRYGIPFDQITAEKLPAEVYFDDKASPVYESRPLSTAIRSFILLGARA